MFRRISIIWILSVSVVLVGSQSSINHVKPQQPVQVKLVLDEPRLDSHNSDYTSQTDFAPVVLWHGMGDTAFGSVNILRRALERQYPGIYVYSVQIGNNSWEDELGGYFVNVNHQIEQACKAILANPNIRSHGSFNAIGFSQGAQFTRGLIQRCPLRRNGIRVASFVSLGGQHQGVFGLPDCPQKIFCDYIRYVLSTAAYDKSIQEHLVQAEYWHDPINEDQYRAKNIFLADINNERTINQTYKDNLLDLDHMVLVEFLQDDKVVPPASSAFEFYKTGQSVEIEPLESSRLYQEDRLGLKELNDSGRLHIIRVPGRHLQFHIDWFMANIAEVYLKE